MLFDDILIYVVIDGFASAADPPLIFDGCHFGRCWNHFGTFWDHFGDFGVIWGAKLEPKVGLEAPGGPPGSPKGSQGAPWEPKVAILVDFGVILGSFLRSKSNQNRCQKSMFFRACILSDFGVFRGAFLRHFFVIFGGCRDRSRKNWICKVCRSYRETR